jgi:hypothetical protein
MGRLGIMLYFDILEPIKVLSDADKGRLLVAMLEYGQSGKNPQFDGMLGLAWGFIKPKIDKDESEYNQSVLRRQYATVCRERKKKNEPEITFDEWVKTLTVCDNHSASMMTNDDQWYPTTTTTTATSTTPTTTTTSTTAAAATANTTEDAAATAYRALKYFQGELGKGVVILSDEQVDRLLETLGLDAFDHYVGKLANFIIKNGASVASHYDTILKWWRADSAVEK